MEYKVKYIGQSFEILGFCSAYDYSWDESFVFNGEAHDLWEIVCVTRGEVEITEDEKIYTLGAGDMILHAPMEFHRIRSAHGTRPSLYVMSFSAAGALPDRLKEGIFRLSNETMEDYGRAFKMIKAFLEHGEDVAGQEASALLSAFLTRLGRTEATSSRLSTSQGALEYERAVRAMKAAVCENLTLSTLASRCFISVSYMKLLFVKYAGISPKSYYSRLRAQYAARLLSEGMSAERVAEKMNFSSPGYFSAFFKQHVGVCPSKYLRSSN